jgi:uncharacterized protein
MGRGSAQVAALAIKHALDGSMLILLVTSRDTQRWVIPKGWPWPKLADHLAAAEEAWEEAGVRGVPSADLVGTFSYEKRLKHRQVPIVVSVYSIDIVDEFDNWPECDERKRAWFGIEDAAAAVDEPELKQLILGLGQTRATNSP